MTMNDSRIMEKVRQVSSTAARYAKEVDRERRFPEESFHALAEEGLLGMLIPPAYGGHGVMLRTFVEGLEMLGNACASTAMCFLMHSTACAVIAAKATPLQVERFLRPVLEEGKRLTLAFSERGTGAHFYSPEIRADFRGERILLHGKKSFVTSGEKAAFLVVLANASQPGLGLDMFVIPANAPGVRFEGEWDGIGMAGNNSISVVLEEVVVTPDNRLGVEGDGTDLVFHVVAPIFLLGVSAVNLGIAEAARTASLTHVKERSYSTGGSLADIPAIQFYQAEMRIALDAARALLHKAAEAADAGREDAGLAVMEAKVLACDTSIRVTQTAMQVTGGQGYTTRLPLERYLRDARAGSVMAPTNDVLRVWIGKSLLGIPLF